MSSDASNKPALLDLSPAASISCFTTIERRTGAPMAAADLPSCQLLANRQLGSPMQD
jgi:hypothetical protein